MDDFDRRQFLSQLFVIPPILLGIITPAEIERIVERQGAVKAPAPDTQSHLAQILGLAHK